MGDWFQIIVDREASPGEAERLASEIRDWLAGWGIVQNTMTNCVLGGDGQGYAPGPEYRQVVDFDHHHNIQILKTNGLQITVGRMVFHPGQGDYTVSCPKCHTACVQSEWNKAIGEWNKGQTGTLYCPICKQSTPITEWTFEPMWGFGNLGFKFWNWPPLKDDFVSEIGKRLAHRIIVVKGKL